jgi:hypothetical protein
MKRIRILIYVIVFSVAASAAAAQVGRQSGSIQGLVMDKISNPLPGVAVTVEGPALMGTQTDVTDLDGSFRLPNLPPGTYTVTTELDGFNTVRRENIVVRVGMTITLNIEINPTMVQEEVTITAAGPAVDVRSSKITQVVTKDIIDKLPLNRDFVDIFKLVPGAAGTIDTYSGSIHGATSTTVTYDLDGVNANSPTHGGPLIYPHYDAMAEIEIITGGLPAQIGNTGGAYVNVVTKSGGNELSGSIQTYYTNENLTAILIPEEHLSALGLGIPSSPIYDWDASGTLGGPILKDKIWFFLDAGYLSTKKYSNFRPTAIMGEHYEQYNIPETILKGMSKVTARFSSELKFFLMFHGEILNRDVYNYWDTKRTYDSRFILDNNTRVAATGNLTWLISSNSFADFRLGYVNRWYPITSDPESDTNPAFTDGYTGYTWNGIPTWQSKIMRQSRQASLRLTHFQDDTLGGDHEFGAGIEYIWGLDRYGYERSNPLTWYYWNGNPYYWRGYYGTYTTHPIFGDGLLQFVNCGNNPHDSEKDLIIGRIGGYLQDSVTIQNRITVNAGIRFDYYNGYMGNAVTTGTAGLPLEIGSILEPELGFNPFGPFEMEPIEDVLVFTTWSPRIGITYDLFGNGKTALKAACSRYAEQVPAWRFDSVSPGVLENYMFNWFDLNGNGQPDSPIIDRYEPTNGLGQFTKPDRDYLISRVDPDLHAPTYDEIIASINHELFKDFALKVQYLYKRGRDFHGWALYDRTTDTFWYNLDNASRWWKPFSTTVPAYDEFPEQQVTAYFRTQDSPWNNQFFLQTNIPESKHAYHGVELSIDKRFSNGWAMGGSVVLSRHKTFTTGESPNDFVNGFGLSHDSMYGIDQPLAIKFFSIFRLPYGIVSSFFYTHTSGAPFGRTVTVVPPPEWAEDNNTLQWSEWVRVEEVDGSRRAPAHDNIDFRLEKEFMLSFGKFSVFMDVYNLSGNSYFQIGEEPGGTWIPAEEGTAQGTFIPGWSYGRILGVNATRVFKFSIRMQF